MSKFDADFILGRNEKGETVFANRNFRKGEIIAEFKGRPLSFKEIKKDSFIDRHCLQVGDYSYIGPSGGLDDIINHSCNPNVGLRRQGRKIISFAIREIEKGEELAWDYSSWCEEEGWEMSCFCGSAGCRGKIRSFSELPENIRKKYIKLGIVPEYVLINMEKLRAFENFLKSSYELKILSGKKVVFVSKKGGVQGLMDFIEKYGRKSKGLVIFDKIVGRGAALLAVYLKTEEVYGKIGSEPAIKALKRFSIAFHFEEVVPNVLNKDKTGMCPIEKLSVGKTPELFYKLIKEKNC